MGKVITMYEEKGLRINEMKMIRPTREMAEQHYAEHKGKPFYEGLIDYITSGNICVMILEGENAIAAIRKINGATDPVEAEMGSIRGKYGVSKSKNAVHASDSAENAEREIAIWFA